MMAGPVLAGIAGMLLLLFGLDDAGLHPWGIVAACVFLAGVAVFAAAVTWTRRTGPSMAENLVVLVVVELLLSGIAIVVAGAMFHGAVGAVWMLLSFAFAPWWLIGVGLVWAQEP